MSKICIHCKKDIEGNSKVYANHVRWCKENPDYEKIKSSTLSKTKINKLSAKKDRIIICTKCGNEFTLSLTDHAYEIGDYRKNCNRTCANSRIHSEETKLKIKITNSSKFEKIIKVCPNCGIEFYHNRNKYCCKTCSLEYRSKVYLNSLDSKESIEKERCLIRQYRLKCNFKFSLSNYPEEFDFTLIEKFGWYQASNHGNNLTGISRDHIYSVMEGYKNGVDPNLLAHPANCQLLIHSDNISKNSKCDITYDELLHKISEWNIKYK